MEYMDKGKAWGSESSQYYDRFTNVKITQLTNYTGHSHHLYFTENGWYDQNRKLLFISDRENKTNLFSIEVSTGEIVQLTDYDTTSDMSVCLQPDGEKAYFRRKNKVIEIHLDNLQERVIYEGPENMSGGNVNCTADGQYVITRLGEDLSKRLTLDLKNGYIGHRELMEAKPKSQIIKISIEKQTAEVIFEEENWITHINTSPTQKNLMTFCHEGPWYLVDHRIWGLDIDTGEVWKIRERKEPREMVGHEYWYADGVTIGYHGFREDGTGFFGKIRYDNQDMEEVEFSFRNWHAFSNDFSKIVVDGKGSLDKIIVWDQVDGHFSKAKILCEHRCSFHSQKVHAHPRFTPDGKKLLFTSDKNGYGNLYLVDLPADFSSLPDLVLK